MEKDVSRDVVILIGGAGYIGRHAAWELHDRGYHCVIIDDLSTGSDQYLPPCDLIVADITTLDTKEIERWRGKVRAVIHFAAKTSAPESVEHPTDYFRTNTFGAVRAARQAAELGAKSFLFSSTAAVYGEPEYNPVDEVHPLRPVNPYGSSKLAAEIGVEEVCNSTGMQLGVLRYFNVAGADPRGRTGDMRPAGENLIHKILACLDSSGETAFKVFGSNYPTADGTAVRDYVHVSDIASAHYYVMKVMERQSKRTMTVNVGYGRGVSVREMLDALVDALRSDLPFDIKDAPRRPGDVAKIWADNSRIRSTGWRPSLDALEDIFRTELDWRSKRAGEDRH